MDGWMDGWIDQDFKHAPHGYPQKCSGPECSAILAERDLRQALPIKGIHDNLEAIMGIQQ